MGKAIVISGADFSAAGIGQVTPTEYRELLSITLEEGETFGNRVTIDVTYNPDNATYKELIWSIESGSEYATINNGVLSVLQGADNSPVTVKAVSAHDESIYDTITVYVTFNAQPYDEEVLYLETDGTAYINTGINTSSDTKFDIIMGLPSEPGNGSIFPFGARKVPSSNCLEFLRSKDSSRYQYRYGNSDGYVAFGVMPVDGYYEVSNVGIENVLELNVSNYESEIQCTANTFDTELNFFLFNLNNQGSPRESGAAGIKIYSCKLYDGSTLVRDFIPVVKDGVGYLFDKVSLELFGNAADSGAFTFGNSVAEDEINEHEGLLFDGNSAIDTGIAVSGSHKIEIKLTAISMFEDTTGSEFRIVLGGRTSSSSNRRDIQYMKGQAANLYPSTYAFGAGSTSVNISQVAKNNGDVITLMSSPTSVAVDNTTQSASIPSFDIVQNYFVGCQNQADGTFLTNTLIYDVIQYVKIWDSSDNLIAHFVPATYQGEAGLWDKIGDNFHGNALSGTLKAI